MALRLGDLDLTERTKRDIEILQRQLATLNLKKELSVEDSKMLDDWIDDFNYSQRLQGANAHQCNSRYDLVAFYVNQSPILKAKKAKHRDTNKYAIAYEKDQISFVDLCRAHKDAFPEYEDYVRVISTVLFFLWDNTYLRYNEETFKMEHNPLLYPFEYKLNPYKRYSASDFPIEITRERVKDEPSFRKMLLKVFQHYFGEYELRYIPKYLNEYLVDFVRKGIWLSTFVNTCSCAVYSIHNNTVKELCRSFWSGYGERSHGIERHIKWCRYEHYNKCVLFEQSCHTSINCAFYEEDLKKRNKPY